MPSHDSPEAFDPDRVPPAPSQPASGHELDLITLGHVLRAKAWVILLLGVAGLLLAAGYIQRAPVLYSSTATLEVKQQEQNIVQMDRAMNREDLRSLDVLQTIAQSLKSRSLFERVMDTNNLAADPRFLVGIPPPPTRERLAVAMAKMTEVRLRRGTRLIDITVVHQVPQMTELIANAIVEEFKGQSVEEYTSTSEVANQFLMQEANRLKDKLQKSENDLQAYRERTAAVSLDDRQNTVVAKLKELSTRVTEAKSARIKSESDYAQVERLGTNIHSLLLLPLVANDAKVTEIQMKLNQQEGEFANLRQRYKEEHPKYLQALSQIQEWRTAFTNAVLQVPQSAKSMLESIRASEQALNAALTNQEAAAIDLNKLSIQYNVLARDVESDRALYEAVLNQLKQTSVAKQAQPTKVKVVQSAYLPEKPFSPKKVKILVLGILGGLFCGGLLTVGLHVLDHSFKTVDQVEAALGMPVLGAIPIMREAQNAKGPIIVSEDPKSAGAEAFRTLRVSLSMLGKAEARKVFLFTSAVPAEGKTFSSLNCAASLAQQGLRTLLIDADLRKPSVQDYFDRNRDHCGVTDYLTGQKTFGEVLQTSKIERLSYMTAGTPAPNPAELLAQGGFAGLLEEAVKNFDRVVVDSSPIHAVSDTLLLVKNVQTVCVVARAAKTPRASVQRAIYLIQKAGGPVAGIILNRLPRHGGVGYGYYHNPYSDYAHYGKNSKKDVNGAK